MRIVIQIKFYLNNDHVDVALTKALTVHTLRTNNETWKMFVVEVGSWVFKWGIH